MEKQNAHVIIVTDCGGSDQGRYEIAAKRCFHPHDLQITFFATLSMNTLHCGFTAAAHVLSSIDHFGSLKDGEKMGLLVNAAPRHGTENGQRLRGDERKKDGEEIYVLLLENGVWVVGPNAGLNFYFLQDQIVESYLVTDTSGGYTPFRSMEVMIPALAKVLDMQEHENIQLTKQDLPEIKAEPGVFIADWDSHGNMYLAVTTDDESWLPEMDQSRVYKIGDKIARLTRRNGIFAGETGEQTLTTGSLCLHGKRVYYIVVVGSSAHSMFGSPPVGTKLEIDRN
jgi:hypothetical protein